MLLIFLDVGRAVKEDRISALNVLNLRPLLVTQVEMLNGQLIQVWNSGERCALMV